jgi:amidohydrolase family protein
MRAAGIVVALCLCAAASGETLRSARIWITNVTIVSPESLDRVAAGSVLVEDGKIAAVHRSADAAPPTDATVVDGNGGYLIPGLIDSHVHVSIVPGSVPPNTAPAEVLRAYSDQLPRSFLYYGYTSLVDLAAYSEAERQRFRGAPLHPDLHDCGPAIVLPGGYPSIYFPPDVAYRVFPNFVVDPAHADAAPPGTSLEEHTPEAAIARVKKAGGICAKIFIERGFRKGNLPVPDAKMLARFRAAATEQGLVLVAHASAVRAQTEALDAGVDVIAHGLWNWESLENAPQVPPEIDALLDRIAKQRVGYQPTIQVLYGESQYFNAQYLDDPRLLDVVPASMVEWFRTPEAQAMKKHLTASEPGATDRQLYEIYERFPLRRVRQATRRLAEKHAKFVFGTDTPSGPVYGNVPGLNEYLEMRNLRDAGLSLEQIFLAATLENARQFKLDRDVGSIEPGKAANLVLLKKSPLESIDAYDSIVTVWLHGAAIPRSQLAANPAPPSPPAAR